MPNMISLNETKAKRLYFNQQSHTFKESKNYIESSQLCIHNDIFSKDSTRSLYRQLKRLLIEQTKDNHYK